jgi:biotin operon repressor
METLETSLCTWIQLKIFRGNIETFRGDREELWYEYTQILSDEALRLIPNRKDGLSSFGQSGKRYHVVMELATWEGKLGKEDRNKICEQYGISTNAVSKILTRLRKMGLWVEGMGGNGRKGRELPAMENSLDDKTKREDHREDQRHKPSIKVATVVGTSEGIPATLSSIKTGGTEEKTLEREENSTRREDISHGDGNGREEKRSGTRSF